MWKPTIGPEMSLTYYILNLGIVLGPGLVLDNFTDLSSLDACVALPSKFFNCNNLFFREDTNFQSPKGPNLIILVHMY